MTEYEKLQVLIKEYDTLRAEILERIKHRFQFVTIIGGVGAFALFQRHTFTHLQTALLITVPIGLIIVWAWIGNLTIKCSVQIAGIERRINEITGEEILTWESKQVSSGFIHRIYKMIFRSS